MNIGITVYLPVKIPLWPSNEWRNDARALISEVVGLSGQLRVKTCWPSKAPVRIERFERPAEHEEFNAVWRQKHEHIDHAFLRFSTEIDVDIDEYRRTLQANNPGWGFEEDMVGSLAADLSAETLARFVADLVLATNIAQPGLMIADERLLFGGGMHIRNHSALPGLGPETRQAMVEEAWPPIARLSVLDVYNWLAEVPGFLEGQGAGRAGRALSAFSYLLDSSSGQPLVTGLVWALVGLEAIYAKGNQGLQSQLIEKSEILLGRRTSHKKSFGRMYDYRSRFVHGDIDFPLHYVSDTNEVDVFIDESGDARDMATRMLTATLQQLVLRRLHTIEYTYHLDPDG